MEGGGSEDARMRYSAERWCRACAGAASYGAGSGLDYRIGTLESGVRVVVAPMPGMYSVAISVLVGAGSRHERPEQAGVAHLIEHLLFKGTERRPSAELISETIERAGGMLNAATDKEQTVYYAKVGREHASTAIDLLADMLLHSLFDEAELARERQVVIEELAMSMDTPQEWVHTLIDAACWPGTALARDVAGTRESVAALDPGKVRGFFAAAYQPGNCVIGVAGALGYEEAFALVEQAFGSWSADPGAGALDTARYSYPSRPPSMRYGARAIEQVNLCLAVSGPGWLSEERHALDLLTSILGGASSSRLFLELRERRGLAYDVHSYSNRLAETGSIVTYLAVDPERAREAADEVMAQLEALRTEPVSARELERAKEYYKGRLLLGLEDTQSVAGWCGGQLLAYGAIQQPEAVSAIIDGVDADQLSTLAGRYFRAEHLRAVALGPKAGKAPLDGLAWLG